MAAKSGNTSFQIDLERPRSGPYQGQWRARLTGRKDPFTAKTPSACLTLVAQTITAAVAELDGKAETPATATKTRTKASTRGRHQLTGRQRWDVRCPALAPILCADVRAKDALQACAGRDDERVQRGLDALVGLAVELRGRHPIRREDRQNGADPGLVLEVTIRFRDDRHVGRRFRVWPGADRCGCGAVFIVVA